MAESHGVGAVESADMFRDDTISDEEAEAIIDVRGSRGGPKLVSVPHDVLRAARASERQGPDRGLIGRLDRRAGARTAPGEPDYGTS